MTRQTVENLFDLSFVVKDGMAKVAVDPETQVPRVGKCWYDAVDHAVVRCGTRVGFKTPCRRLCRGVLAVFMVTVWVLRYQADGQAEGQEEGHGPPGTDTYPYIFSFADWVTWPVSVSLTSLTCAFKSLLPRACQQRCDYGK